jgi:predicted amino acid-binding ACT domain protein
MKKAGIAVGEKKTVFLIQGDDKIGAVAEVMGKLGKAGINVTTIDAVATGKGRFGAILWVKPADVAKTAKILRAS